MVFLVEGSVFFLVGFLYGYAYGIRSGFRDGIKQVIQNFKEKGLIEDKDD